MILTVFEWLSNSMQSNLMIALIASLLWGVLSILLSPCHLASIPLIVAFIGEQGKMSTKRAFWLAASFSLGILTTIAAIGLITGLLGRMLGDIGSYGNYIVAIIFFIIGLHLLEIIQLPFLAKTNQPAFRKKGLLAAFGLGFILVSRLVPVLLPIWHRCWVLYLRYQQPSFSMAFYSCSFMALVIVRS